MSLAKKLQKLFGHNWKTSETRSDAAKKNRKSFWVNER